MTDRLSPIQSRGPHRQGAFTLLEVMAVVVLLGIAATVVSLRLESATDRARLEATAAQIEQMFGMAAQEARTRKRPVNLVFNLPRGALRIERDKAPGEQEGDWRSFAGVSLSEVQVGATRSTVAIARVRITPAGVSLPWSASLSRGQHQLRLCCDGVTGAFQREEPGGTRQ